MVLPSARRFASSVEPTVPAIPLARKSRRDRSSPGCESCFRKIPSLARPSYRGDSRVGGASAAHGMHGAARRRPVPHDGQAALPGDLCNGVLVAA
jgi:hypothetical protein